MTPETKKYLLLGTAAILLIGAFVFGKMIDIPNRDNGVAVAQEISSGQEKSSAVEIFADDMILGNQDKNAKVTIIEYASMTCPHCAAFHNGVGQKLYENYVKTNKVRFIYRDFPLDGAALKAAQLAWCDASKRKAFTDILYKKQAEWTKGATRGDVVQNLEAIGKMGGLSSDKMKECLFSKTLEEQIIARQKHGAENFTIKATPTIFVNGKAFEGETSYEDLQKYIDGQLGK